MSTPTHNNLLAQHFRLLDRDPHVESYLIPGDTGETNKDVFAPAPYVIEETGICETLYLNTILANRGKSSYIYNTLNALNLGTFSNVWKQSATAESLHSADTDKLSYRIVWRQVTVSDPTPPSY